MPEDRSRLLYC